MESITQLFSKKSIAEVLEFKRKSRHDIELKKEELRQMVGERYRDLIEAADTISEMKVCSNNVKTSVKDLQQFCTSKSLSKNKQLSSIKKQTSSKALARYMEIAAQSKVLMEMPEKIWSHVEASQMISAALLYLQSLQILKNLSLDGATSYSPVLLWFPMLGQQAQAVGNLRSAILKECHNQIQDHLLHTERLAEALCSIAILEKASCADVLQALLKSRSRLLREILSGERSYGEDHMKNLGEKAKICCSVAIVRQTVLQIFDLFCKDNGGMIADLLTKCTDDSSLHSNLSLPQIDSPKLWTKFLPKGITTVFNYEPGVLVISTDIIRSLCLAWFAECEAELTKGIQNSLKFTATAKDLANIRSALMEILDLVGNRNVSTTKDNEEWTDPDLDGPHHIDDLWLRACKAIFNREIFLWKDVLSKLFLEKINLLVNETFNKLMEASTKIFTLTPEIPVSMKTMNSYVWQEHDNDIMPDMAWNPWQTRKQNNLSSQGGLSLKAATVTPDVRRACESVNEMMRQLLSDLNYCAPDLAEEQQKFLHQTQSKQTIIEEIENKAVMEHLKTSCYKFLQNLIAHISKLESESMSVQSKNDLTSLDNILHLSLLCRNFFDLSHSFQQCCCQKEILPPNSFKRQLSSNVGKSRLDRSKSVDSAWNEVVDTMHQKSHSLMAVWCKAILSDALKPYKESLLASVLNQNLLNSMAIWDSLTVEEENESGEKVTSQIKIPATASSYAVEFLYFLCSEMNRVGGHSASRFTLRHLSQASLKSIYEVFSAARRTFSVGDTNLHGQSRASGVSSTPTQTWALQSLFDLRYVHSLLYQSSLNIEDDKTDDDEDEQFEGSPSYTFTELVDWLEGYVDPFDLDVFSPHITRNIQRYVARTCVMLGMLSSPEKLNTSSTQKYVATSKDSHNVLPLAPDCGRFSYLPVSGRSTNKRLSQTVDRALTRQLPLASALRDLTRDSIGINEKHGRLTSSLYSKLGALSSSWLSAASQED